MEAKEKEWLKKRVKMPDDQADGDPGTIVKVERRKEQKTRRLERGKARRKNTQNASGGSR